MVGRKLEEQILKALTIQKIIILTGTSGSGKSTLLNRVIAKLPSPKYALAKKGNNVHKILSTNAAESLPSLFSDIDYLIIEDIHEIADLDKKLKLLINLTSIRIILVTYSLLEFEEKLQKYLVHFPVHPLSMTELYSSKKEALKNLDYHLIYGFYPEIERSDSLEEKKQKYERIINKSLRHSKLNYTIALAVLRILAQNLSNNITFSKYSSALHIDKKTFKHYLRILERHHLIFSITTFFGKLSKEMSKATRYYFWDTGLRNYLIDDFRSPDERDDMEQLWENFCVSERRKRNINLNFKVPISFWHTYDRKVIPYIEHANEFIFGYGFRWKKQNKAYPKIFVSTYPNSVFMVIDKEMFWSFIT